MRSRISTTLSAVLITVALVVPTGAAAFAQSVDEAEQDLSDAEQAVDHTTGLVDQAIANHQEIELQLAEAMSKMSDISAALSAVSVRLNRLGDQLGYADVELVSIQEQIEIQAVDAYMAVLASPTLSLVGSGNVERALVVSTVVEDVVAGGRQKAGELFILRRGIHDLRDAYMADHEEFAELKGQLDAESDYLTQLLVQSDADVAAAVQEANAASAAYVAALSAVELAQLQEEERIREEARATTTTTSSTTTTAATPVTAPTTTLPSATTTSNPPSPTTTGDGTPWLPNPAVEQWRSLVEQHFPANRVEEALKIMQCESGGNPQALNPTSGAAGLFQFMPGTWATSAPPAGYPGSPLPEAAFDPEANTATAAWLANRYQELGLPYWQAWSCRNLPPMVP